jgi:hypothetical protein
LEALQMAQTAIDQPMGRQAMANIIEHAPERLVLRAGSTTLTLDRSMGRATLQRKLLFWPLKPAEHSLSDVTDVATDVAVDRASGVEVCNTMLVMRGGQGWALPASDKKDAEASARAIREFLDFD